MREDMADVLVLRGRIARRPWRRGRPRGLTSLPKHEPMGRGWGSKILGENLAPLRRFLERSVGRSWNDVRSEIAARLDGGNAVQRHVLVHLAELVEEHVMHVEGHPHDAQGRPLWLTRWHRFHVDRDGVLRHNPLPPRRLP